MSYEGYVERLCKNGHLRSFDCWEDNEETKCLCGEPFVFRHDVDQTNGDDPNDQGTMPFPFEVDRAATYVTCNLGHKHITSETTYKIPKAD